MPRQNRPQRTTPPTPNDLRHMANSVDSIIVNIEEMQEWKKSVTKNSSDVADFIDTQLEKVFERINKIEAKLRDLDKKVNGKKATASPTKVVADPLPTDGGEDAK